MLEKVKVLETSKSFALSPPDWREVCNLQE